MNLLLVRILMGSSLRKQGTGLKKRLYVVYTGASVNP